MLSTHADLGLRALSVGLPSQQKPCFALAQQQSRSSARGSCGWFWSYSNVGIRLAAHVAEIVTGELLPRLVERLVFQSLEMRRATFDPLMALTYPLALPHDVNAD